MNTLFMQQMWSGNLELYQSLQSDKSPLGQERLHYFWINKGPWSEIDDHAAFLPGVPARKPPGANFYPEDMTKEEFEAWVKTLSPDRKSRRKDSSPLMRRAESEQRSSKSFLTAWNTKRSREACKASAMKLPTLRKMRRLKKFLTTRAAAFASNDYFESDMAWMDLDAPLDVTIGPYETYNDELFGYKAAFEAYVNMRDDKESTKLAFFGNICRDLENNLPEDPQYRNREAGSGGADPRGE